MLRIHFLPYRTPRNPMARPDCLHPPRSSRTDLPAAQDLCVGPLEIISLPLVPPDPGDASRNTL
jgi:hypothetical protein